MRTARPDPRWRRRSGAPMIALFITAALAGSACDRSTDAVREHGPADVELRRELLRMGLLDQTARAGLHRDAPVDTAVMRSVLAIDSLLTARLRGLVRSNGWPTFSSVGEAAAKAAFLIVQHSPVIAFQREVLPHLAAAAAAGEAQRSDAALLEDRVLVEDGKPQRFGTQFRIVDGVLTAYPIAEPETLEQRRATVGLMPMEEYVRLLERSYGGPVEYRTTGTAADTTS